MMKGEFYVLEYIGWDNFYTEIVTSDRIRHKNTNPPLDKSMIHKFEIEVPEEFRELYVSYEEMYIDSITFNITLIVFFYLVLNMNLHTPNSRSKLVPV